jgi:hypothetical protein
MIPAVAHVKGVGWQQTAALQPAGKEHITWSGFGTGPYPGGHVWPAGEQGAGLGFVPCTSNRCARDTVASFPCCFMWNGSLVRSSTTTKFIQRQDRYAIVRYVEFKPWDWLSKVFRRMERRRGGGVHAKQRPWKVSTLVLKKAAWHVETVGAADGLQHSAAKLQLAVGHMICSGLSETGTPCGHV